MTATVLSICTFTFVIHMTESLAYAMRLAGVRTKQIAIALSFVTSTLLISRLSNMFQAPLMGALVDASVMDGSSMAISVLTEQFRIIIFAGFLGSLIGACLTPTAVYLFQKAILRFLKSGSLPKVFIASFYPRNLFRVVRAFRLPNLTMCRGISWKSLPKGFLILNVLVTSIYAIGVLCALLAGAKIPELRATAIQLSGIVNGLATILFTLFVDPAGARITDQAVHTERPESDVRSVVFFLQAGRLLGTLCIAQVLLVPFTHYIMWVTKWIGNVAI